jgi:hypothetical protein
LSVSGLGGKLVEYSGGTTWFFATNHLGTIAARMDLSGQTMETYRNLPYGERYARCNSPEVETPRRRCRGIPLSRFCGNMSLPVCRV